MEKIDSDLIYSDDYLKKILSDVDTVAMVGASSNWNRPSFFAMKYLLAKGFKVFPINPVAAGQEILGELVYSNLNELPVKVDMVDIFRAQEHIFDLTKEAIGINARIIWMQEGIIDKKSASLGKSNGLKVVMDKCPKKILED